MDFQKDCINLSDIKSQRIQETLIVCQKRGLIILQKKFYGENKV